MSFQDLPNNPDFAALEKATLDWWSTHNIVNLYLHKNDDSPETFSFIDGPITANNPMGVHHARGRTLKDLFQRFKNAQGFAQRFQNGFDCQGLWVEVEVEKEAGFNSKKDIQNFGLENFTNACLTRVDKYSKIQTEQSQRLGMFMDWDNSYYTNSKNNNLYIWHFLKIINDKGWLCKKKSAATWCPRCETGLSQHEEADGYKEITDTSVYLKFKLKDRDNEYVLAWTTTPWTLSANVLLAINTEYQYVKAKHDRQTLYLAELSAKRLGLTDYESIDVNTLLNLEYDSLYNIPAQENIKHYITNWDLVNPEEGTGVVHIAPGCGQEDFELGKKLKSDMVAPLDERGHFLEGYGELSGLYAHDVAPQVIEYLETSGNLFKTEPIIHRYPHCWRCKTKCLFRLEDSWYIKSDDIRPLMKAAANKINWHPKYVGRRMQNWLDSMEDWMISRKRFYGLALPFYKCSCGELTVIGSLEELKAKAINPELVVGLTSLHRPWIDTIEIKCPKCSKNVSRITDVGDCWLDAGVVPFSTLKYLSDKSYWQKWFPADLVLEMIEQVRLWFYSMLFFSVALENTIPYKNVVAHGEVRDENGDPIHKTKKNGIPYDDAVTKMGADAMRWLYSLQKSHANVNFGYNIANQIKRDFFLILWNSYRFFTQHTGSADFKVNDFDPHSATDTLDRWLISRLHQTINSVTKDLDKFSSNKAAQSLQDFLSDLSTWYIRRNRDRTDNSALLAYVFGNYFRLIAPFTPFIAEYLYQNLHQTNFSTTKSVHLETWPTADLSLIDDNLNKLMPNVRDICQLIHGQRQAAAIKIRQPLALVTISTPNPITDPKLIEIICQETNIKQVNFVKSAEYSVKLDTNLTADLITEGEYRDFVRQIQILRKEQGLNLDSKIKIIAPSWPASFTAQIKSKTLAVSLVQGPELQVIKVD
ncbi:MAG: isoleucine--tRNA ligase [Candidatus Shapirobacteria bacterium]|nr:isoleucine--tRNA ligase [Candidatus Shapirobacteria bacterium]